MNIETQKKYFKAIKNSWSPFESSERRIIPFCTPIVQSPDAIVIGTNHSDFVNGGGDESNLIADAFANDIPLINTYTHHQHNFAIGLRAICLRSEITISDNWVGTNRCAIQTGPSGIRGFLRINEFIKCQIQMDEILREFIREIRPKNIILAGKHAMGLYYQNNLTLNEISPYKIEEKDLSIRLNLIPIPHPSRATYWEEAARRLRNSFLL